MKRGTSEVPLLELCAVLFNRMEWNWGDGGSVGRTGCKLTPTCWSVPGQDAERADRQHGKWECEWVDESAPGFCEGTSSVWSRWWQKFTNTFHTRQPNASLTADDELQGVQGGHSRPNKGGVGVLGHSGLLSSSAPASAVPANTTNNSFSITGRGYSKGKSFRQFISSSPQSSIQ